MIFQTNLIAIVSGGRYPKYSHNTVYIYDAMIPKFVMEINCSSAVKAVRMRRNRQVIQFRPIFIVSSLKK